MDSLYYTTYRIRIHNLDAQGKTDTRALLSVNNDLNPLSNGEHEKVDILGQITFQDIAISPSYSTTKLFSRGTPDRQAAWLESNLYPFLSLTNQGYIAMDVAGYSVRDHALQLYNISPQISLKDE